MSLYNISPLFLTSLSSTTPAGIASKLYYSQSSPSRVETPSCKAIIMSSKLDALPVEILHRIASVGACEAALALSGVNRALHLACNDRLVYKAIIDNRNGTGGPKWQHCLPLSVQSPTSSWARYALADSKAAQYHTMNLNLEECISWLPQLMACHCKAFSGQVPQPSMNSPFQIPFSILAVP